MPRRSECENPKPVRQPNTHHPVDKAAPRPRSSTAFLRPELLTTPRCDAMRRDATAQEQHAHTSTPAPLPRPRNPCGNQTPHHPCTKDGTPPPAPTPHSCSRSNPSTRHATPKNNTPTPQIPHPFHAPAPPTPPHSECENSEPVRELRTRARAHRPRDAELEGAGRPIRRTLIGVGLAHHDGARHETGWGASLTAYQRTLTSTAGSGKPETTPRVRAGRPNLRLRRRPGFPE